MVKCACGEEFQPKSIADAGISGDQLTFPCPNCGRRVFFGFNKVGEIFDMTKDEVRELRDKLKAEKQAEEKEQEEIEEPLFLDPRKKLADELREFFEDLNQKFGFGLKKKFVELVATGVEDDGQLPFPNELGDIIRQANSGVGNKYEIDVIVRRYNSWLQEHQQEIGGLPQSGLRVSSSAPMSSGLQIGRRENAGDLSQYPKELREIVEQRRAQKRAKSMRKELGIDKIEREIAALTSTISSSSNENEDKQLLEDSIKWRILREMGLDNDMLKSQNPYESIGDSAVKLGSAALESLAPIGYELAESMSSTQKILSEIIARDMGVDVNQLQGSREAPSFEEVKDRIEKEEGEET